MRLALHFIFSVRRNSVVASVSYSYYCSFSEWHLAGCSTQRHVTAGSVKVRQSVSTYIAPQATYLHLHRRCASIDRGRRSD